MRIRIQKKDIVYYLFTIYVCFMYCNNELFSSNTICKNYIIVIMLLFLMLFWTPNKGSNVVRTDNLYIYSHLFIAALAIVSVSWTEYRAYFYQVPITLVCNIIFAYVYKNGLIDRPIIHIINSFILAGIVASAKMLLTVPKSAYGWAVEFPGMGNRNILGTCLSVSAALCFLAYDYTKKIIYLILMAGLYYVALLSGSKKGVIVGIIIIFFSFFFTDGLSKRVQRALFVALIIFVSLYILKNNNELNRVLGSRFALMFNFLKGKGDDGSTAERLFLMKYSFGLFLRNPIIGWGVNGVAGQLLKSGVHRVSYSHCNYTELLANYGIIGFSLYYSNYIMAIVTWERAKKKYGISAELVNEAKIGISIILSMIVLEFTVVAYTELSIQTLIIFAIMLLVKVDRNQNEFTKYA